MVEHNLQHNTADRKIILGINWARGFGCVEVTREGSYARMKGACGETATVTHRDLRGGEGADRGKGREQSRGSDWAAQGGD